MLEFLRHEMKVLVPQMQFHSAHVGSSAAGPSAGLWQVKVVFGSGAWCQIFLSFKNDI